MLYLHLLIITSLKYIVRIIINYIISYNNHKVANIIIIKTDDVNIIDSLKAPNKGEVTHVYNTI